MGGYFWNFEWKQGNKYDAITLKRKSEREEKFFYSLTAVKLSILMAQGQISFPK
jgi:hypothetical protein